MVWCESWGTEKKHDFEALKIFLTATLTVNSLEQLNDLSVFCICMANQLSNAFCQFQNNGALSNQQLDQTQVLD